MSVKENLENDIPSMTPANEWSSEDSDASFSSKSEWERFWTWFFASLLSVLGKKKRK